jgi:hypothetical protein
MPTSPLSDAATGRRAPPRDGQGRGRGSKQVGGAHFARKASANQTPASPRLEVGVGGTLSRGVRARRTGQGQAQTRMATAAAAAARSFQVVGPRVFAVLRRQGRAGPGIIALGGDWEGRRRGRGRTRKEGRGKDTGREHRSAHSMRDHAAVHGDINPVLFSAPPFLHLPARAGCRGRQPTSNDTWGAHSRCYG